jgi:hypothetical protein
MVTMGKVNAWAQEKIVRDLARAAAAGHDVNHLEHVRKGTAGANAGHRAVCTCGWTSTPRGRRVIAAMAGLWHAQEVCAVLDERRDLDLVEWSEAPSSSALHGASKARSADSTRRAG